MPFDLTPILLDAARAADEPVPPLRPVDPADVEAVLVTVPACVREWRERFRNGEPGTGDGSFFFVSTLTKHFADKYPGALSGHERLRAPVAARLRAAGLDADDSGSGAIRVSLASLKRAAGATNRDGWIEAVTPLWRARAGAEATVVPHLQMPWLAQFTARPAGGELASTARAWAESPAEAVAGAAVALRLPAWTLEQLGAAWQIAAGEGATVERRAGYPGSGGAWRPVACLRFAVPYGEREGVQYGGERFLDVEDIRDLDASAVLFRLREILHAEDAAAQAQYDAGLRLRPPVALEPPSTEEQRRMRKDGAISEADVPLGWPSALPTEPPIAGPPPADVAEGGPAAPRPGKGGRGGRAEA